MAEYHKYIFDESNRSFIGEFEEMYQQEGCANFDSWHQDDSRQLNRKIALNILEQWNFQSILDIGCGKGALTHLMKKQNNNVVGVDISETAINVAQSRFPDIQFKSLDVGEIYVIDELISDAFEGGVDLVFSSEVLSYLENWKDLVGVLSKKAKYLMVSLYIPEDPIGYVKSREELHDAVSEVFDIIESVHLVKSRFTILFAKSNMYHEV